MLDFQKTRINTDLLAASGTARHKQDLRIENLKPCSRSVCFAPFPQKAWFFIILFSYSVWERAKSQLVRLGLKIQMVVNLHSALNFCFASKIFSFYVFVTIIEIFT